jgi:PPP family 3-phenylpropionic acid transporter
MWMRGAYWWAFGAIGTLTPFIAPYYKELGFSGTEIGVLVALPATGVAFFAPIWGAIADSRANHRLVLRAALLIPAMLGLLLTQLREFWPIFLLVATLALLYAPAAPLIDSYGLMISERHMRSYGSLRVWGSLGFTAGVFVVGELMGADVTALFLLAYSACLLLACLCTLRLPRLSERSAGPLWGGLGAVARNGPLVALLLTTFLISSSASAMYGFLSIHLRELGGSAELVGRAFALNAASELPVVAFGAWFLSRLGSTKLLGLAIVVYIIRFIAYALIPDPEWVLPVQLLHGLSYGAFLMASVTLVHGLAGRQLAATAQGLLTSMSFGFGSISGSLVGGVLLDRIGTVGIFWIAAGVMTLTLGVYVATVRRFHIEDMRTIGTG